MFADDHSVLIPMMLIPKSTHDDIIKVLKWVKDNPGVHPANVRYELIRLGKLLGV